MLLRPLSLLVAFTVLSTTAMSQTCFYSHTADPLVAFQEGNFAPLGQSNTSSPMSRITQFVVLRYGFQNAPVRITGLAFSMDAIGVMRYQTIRIRMCHTTNDSLSGLFAANVSTPQQTVLETHDYVWPHPYGTWTEIGLQTPFVYTPTAATC
jgi:hypothetical protein